MIHHTRASMYTTIRESGFYINYNLWLQTLVVLLQNSTYLRSEKSLYVQEVAWILCSLQMYGQFQLGVHQSYQE